MLLRARKRPFTEIYGPKIVMNLRQQFSVQRRLLNPRGCNQVVARNSKLIYLYVGAAQSILRFANTEVVAQFKEESLGFIQTSYGCRMFSEKTIDPSKPQLDARAGSWQ